MRPVEVGSSFPSSRSLKIRKGVYSKQLCCEHKRVPKIRKGVCSKQLKILGSAQSSTAGCSKQQQKCAPKTGKDCLGRGARPLRGRLGLRGTRLGPLGLGLRGLGFLLRLRLVAAKHSSARSSCDTSFAHTKWIGYDQSVYDRFVFSAEKMALGLFRMTLMAWPGFSRWVRLASS